jgi:hypothetical protein
VQELANQTRRSSSAMKDARTYRQFAADCTKLVKAMPQHRAMLEDMAAAWQRLAEAAEKRESKREGKAKT